MTGRGPASDACLDPVLRPNEESVNVNASPRLSILSATIAVALLTSACTADAGRVAASAAPAQPASVSPGPASTTPAPLASTEAGAYVLGRFPSTPNTQFSDPTIAALQAVLDKAVREGLPGVTASILAAGRGAWTGAAGTSDGVKPMEVASQFGIASTTKTVIAAEIMWLAEQGLLSAGRSGVGPPARGAWISTPTVPTIRHLLSMTSGLPDPALIDDPAADRGPAARMEPRGDPRQRAQRSHTRRVPRSCTRAPTTSCSASSSSR